MLPTELRYLIPVLERYTIYPRSEGSVEAYAPLVRSLAGEQINEIAQVYKRMDAHGHGRALSRWIDERGSPKPREWELFLLFRALARAGFAPFTDESVEYDLGPVRLDWSKLPAEFEYLREPATKYG